MKWALYSAAMLFLAGGAVCSGPPAPQSADSKADRTQQNGNDTQFTSAPADEKKSDEKTDPPSYTKDIKPFFTKYCVECHNAKVAKSGFNFDGYDTMMKGGRKGPGVVANEPDKSMAMRVLSGKGKAMPPSKYKNQPKAEDVAMFKAWINAGAKDDTEKGSSEK
jgi:hypothetical protein